MSRLLVAVAAWCGLLAAGVPARAALVLVAVGVVCWWCRGRGGARAAVGHSHGGTNRFVARHEAGHAAVARGLGGRVLSVITDRHGGGLTMARLPDGGPVSAIAFWTGGRAAAGGAGCSADDALIRRELRSVPSRDRARVRREGVALGRKLVRRHADRVRRDAATIERTGRL